jgi:hypothetical protein
MLTFSQCVGRQVAGGGRGWWVVGEVDFVVSDVSDIFFARMP